MFVFNLKLATRTPNCDQSTFQHYILFYSHYRNFVENWSFIHSYFLIKMQVILDIYHHILLNDTYHSGLQSVRETVPQLEKPL